VGPGCNESRAAGRDCGGDGLGGGAPVREHERRSGFEWLERAYAQRDIRLTEIKGDPLLRRLESDPRYPAFLKKMRLPL
jgi:hypothetical protein